MMEGDAFLEKGVDLVVLGEGFQKGLVGVQVLLDDCADSGGFTARQEVAFDFGGVDLTVLAAKDEEEGRELVPLEKEFQGVIHLVQEALRTDLSFHRALFTG